ncbi:hypothetical protein SAMN05216353_10769 [Halobacillus alkaliphilus]|uniref:Uncharacterized protein n=1 Tax=Halobacillus alkaliphilus TaxID=396056 RepID=A0A1I2L259_9BACI|nr:hypothetical protein [Halobacillus alkaliphilus]SFF73422.1 hypothetical protein SAMN05216353_10769 [Halobacillus alkaliphilus]
MKRQSLSGVILFTVLFLASCMERAGENQQRLEMIYVSSNGEMSQRIIRIINGGCSVMDNRNRDGVTIKWTSLMLLEPVEMIR